MAAMVLHRVHLKGVIHRDIKPDNLIITNEKPSRVIVTDFGSAIDIEKPVPKITKLGGWVGTPAYMAPEGAKCQEPSPQWDIYNLGAVLYELLCGEVPFKGDPEVVRHKLQDKNEFRKMKCPRENNASVPPPLEEIILKAMQWDSSRRYQSGEEMAKALRGWLDS